jgi:hypothetical protein
LFEGMVKVFFVGLGHRFNVEIASWLRK